VIKGSNAYKFAPKEKLRWHCLGRLVRFHVPEVLGGQINYLKEEAEDFKTPKKVVVEVEEPERPQIEKEALEATKEILGIDPEKTSDPTQTEILPPKY